MTLTELPILLPEIIVLAATMLVLIAGLFTGRHQSRISYAISQLALIVTILFVVKQIDLPTTYALHNMFIVDHASTLSKLAILIFSVFALGYSQSFFS